MANCSCGRTLKNDRKQREGLSLPHAGRSRRKRNFGLERTLVRSAVSVSFRPLAVSRIGFADRELFAQSIARSSNRTAPDANDLVRFLPSKPCRQPHFAGQYRLHSTMMLEGPRPFLEAREQQPTKHPLPMLHIGRDHEDPTPVLSRYLTRR